MSCLPTPNNEIVDDTCVNLRSLPIWGDRTFRSYGQVLALDHSDFRQFQFRGFSMPGMDVSCSSSLYVSLVSSEGSISCGLTILMLRQYSKAYA